MNTLKLFKNTRHLLFRSNRYQFASDTFAPYNHTDPLNFTSLLTEEEKLVMESARSFSQTHLAPVIR